jgi:hypothetical protein
LLKYEPFFISHTISSVCFGCFDIGLEHQNKPKNFFGVSQKNEKQPKQIEFRFASVRIEKKKLTVSRTFFGDFFGLFRQSSVCFSCFNTGPKHRNKPKKMFFSFAKQTKKKFDCYEDTLVVFP